MAMMEGEADGHYTTEEEEDDHQSSSSSSSDEEYDSDSDDYHGGDVSDHCDESTSRGDGGGIMADLKQHMVALLVAAIAAIATHAQIHGGYGVWKEELAKDWLAVKTSFARGGDASLKVKEPLASSPIASYAAAPSMDAIPSSERKRVLERALGKDYANGAAKEEDARGHEKARNFRRTRGLSFCPTNRNTSSSSKVNKKNNNHNLVEMEFILPLQPSVGVLHSYYLADAFGVDHSMVYEELELTDKLGSYTSDTILNEIDSLNAAHGNDGLALDQIQSVLNSHLPESSMVNRQHACLLHQYTLNKKSGRSIRGTTKVYDQPHVSTFYRNKLIASNDLAVAVEPNYKLPPASLTFTGYAAKFINLSLNSLNLYWDGGRIPSGPQAGKMHTVLVGTVASMESIGTSSFPGHSFFLTPTYDKEHVLQRWTITEDEPVLYYDPLFGDMSVEGQREELDRLVREGKWTEKQRFSREAWMVDRSYGRDYLIKTGRVWLANFPQPCLASEDVSGNDGESGAMALFDDALEEAQDVGHETHMWQANYIGQTHTVNTTNLYYTALPTRMDRLTKEDYLPEVEERRLSGMRQFQSSNIRNAAAGGTSMSLSLKALSVAPRVLEVKKFLSPVEVQHLIDLASGKKGDVILKRSTVSASNVKGNSSKDNKVRGSQQADVRSSSNGWVHREQDVIVDTIFRRIADLLNIDENLMRDVARDDDSYDDNGIMSDTRPTHDRIVEAMQLLRYEPGEEYQAHHDFTYPSIENRYQPKRYATVLLYLTGEGDVVDEKGVRRSAQQGEDGLEGGETTFPRAITTNYHDGIKVGPQSGKAIVFYNTLPDGNMDDLSQHSGGKVENGVKYIANVWVWDPIVN